ncbi:MAG: Rne/Rng family ribonuclease [Sphingomonas sp.]|uniref:Rne/Rng family ribonuclease n=1 Tax=Sphingomonas sp. TaxID=28214 RepID=UPI002601618D|nr:Rne/Rng family ribonuclease [Sphingomonas sp.]MDK2768265.1 Rne/Rng family ribonuclease [Sphingomonas sp.]
MTMRMLIDARHREETRVAVVKGNRIEEFDFESAERKQLKGNIYLAKVTRVEPSLQAAFVEYGGNRHGFLAFSEIHPDYYQIPKEDREALLREEAEHAAEEAALREADDSDDHDHDDEDGDVEVVERPSDEDEEGGETAEGEGEGDNGKGRRRRGRKGSDDQVEALRQRRMNLRRRYKIQDVIRRRQVLLVQVVKEERGNKGAALTTYLSLAGRYCVLMPNTAHGGGISRKISSAADRKRLKTIMADLKLPPSMGCIVRTAGLQRTKTEIKRDFDYLARLWDEIREKTLQSSAPALVYGDSDLMKRAIRDIYNKDIDEVIVEGDEGYRQAKDFMKLLMPSHAKKVKHYSDAVPLFQRAGVEEQLSAMYHPVVQLKSGGYLVINPTEALVSIDINSGRSTREHSIEQTATATNLEAAQEIARQLRLRDMAGLVVIDFIDMDHSSNVRKVEKAMKEALKNDRARIQVGRISAFGLMEMSRQRLRTGVLEASTRQCPHCEGTGLVRTASSAGLSALRLIEDEAARGRGSHITLRCSQEAAFYVLNNKRADIAEIEDRYGVRVEILSDGELEGARMSVEASGPPPAHAPKFAAAIQEIEEDIVDEIDEEEDEEEEEVEARAPRERRDRGERAEGDGEGRKRRRRRRGRRGRREDGDAPHGEGAEQGSDGEDADEGADTDADSVETVDAGADAPVAASEGEGRKRRRRGRRGGRRGTGGEDTGIESGAADAEDAAPVEAEVVDPVTEPVAEEAPAKPKRSRRKKADADPVSETVEAAEPAPVDTAVEAPVAEEAPAKPKRTRRKKGEEAPAAETAPVEAPVAEEAIEAPVVDEAPAKPKRSRRKKADEAPAAEVTQDLAPPAADADSAPAEAVEAAPVEAAAESGESDSAPRRGGWWQRTFGA